jgi:hypothetical protein
MIAAWGQGLPELPPVWQRFFSGGKPLSVHSSATNDQALLSSVNNRYRASLPSLRPIFREQVRTSFQNVWTHSALAERDRTPIQKMGELAIVAIAR